VIKTGRGGFIPLRVPPSAQNPASINGGGRGNFQSLISNFTP